MEGLEARVKQCTSVNESLLQKVKQLEEQNLNLIQQLKKVHDMVKKTSTKTTQATTCVMVSCNAKTTMVIRRKLGLKGS